MRVDEEVFLDQWMTKEMLDALKAVAVEELHRVLGRKSTDGERLAVPQWARWKEFCSSSELF